MGFLEFLIKSEKIEWKKEVSFTLLGSNDTLEALKQLISVISYSLYSTITIQPKDFPGKIKVTVSNADAAIVCEYTAPVWQRRFLGDEWGEITYEQMTAIVMRINGEYFIATNNKLYYYPNNIAEGELGLDKLFRV
jgi:hypothetical protein